MSLGLYIHIPFCEQHCHYCAFPVAVSGVKSHNPYVGRLMRELDLIGLAEGPATLYLGGGTPSLLDPDLIARLLGAVPAGASEVSLEANPGTLDPRKLDRYLELGINRISLGAQSFDKSDLERAGRLHEPEDSIQDFETLRRQGFNNINLDLIAGLPGQDRRAWSQNLDWIERLGPDHVSIYLLELEEGTFWGKRKPATHAEDDHAWFYSSASERLPAAGYVHYEVSSWARPGSECRHNQGYWNQTPYRGVGLGAHSYIDGRRFWNTRSMEGYARRLDAGELPIETFENRTRTIRLEEAFLLGLRQMQGFDVWTVANEIGIDYPQEWFDRLENLQEARLVEFDGTILRLAPAGWLLATGITEELLCPTLLSICEATP